MDLYHIIVSHNRWSGREALMLFVIFCAVSLICLFLYKLGNKPNTKRKIIPALTKTQAISLTLLIFFMCVVITSTVFTRMPKNYARYELVPLWSWYEVLVHGKSSLLKKILLNVALLMPMGFLLPLTMGRKIKSRNALLLGLLFSFAIELTQLLLHRGLFEFDDMLHNAVGCMLGCLFANKVLDIVAYL